MRDTTYAEKICGIYPHTGFFKVKKHLEKNASMEERQENIIIEDDLNNAEIERLDIRNCIQLPIDKYPSVYRSMTASQAIWWAITKCRNVGWKVNSENIFCCLAQLEMDM